MTKAEAWRILGLPPGSGRDAVKERYAELAVRYHPEEEPKKFAAVHEAYKTVLEEGASQTGSGTEDVFFWEEEPGGRTDASSDGFDRQRGEDEWGSEFLRLEKQYDEEQEEKRKKEEAEKLREKRRKEQIRKQTDFIKKWTVLPWFAAYLSLGAVSVPLFFAAQAIDSFNKSVFDGCFHSMDILYITIVIFAALLPLGGPFLLLSLAKRYTPSDIPAFFADRFGRKKDKERKRSKLRWIPRFLLLGILLTAVDDVLDYSEKHECGFGLKWEISKDGNFVIIGTGAMPDYEDWDDVPWDEIKDRIRTIVLSEGVERVGKHAFYGCDNLEWVQIEGNLKEIGEWAFASCPGLKDIRFLDNAPHTVGSAAFWYVTDVSLHYPAGDPTWNEDVLTVRFWEANNQDGFVWRWIPFGPDGQDLEDETVVHESPDMEEIYELIWKIKNRQEAS